MTGLYPIIKRRRVPLADVERRVFGEPNPATKPQPVTPSFTTPEPPPKTPRDIKAEKAKAQALKAPEKTAAEVADSQVASVLGSQPEKAPEVPEPEKKEDAPATEQVPTDLAKAEPPTAAKVEPSPVNQPPIDTAPTLPISTAPVPNRSGTARRNVGSGQGAALASAISKPGPVR